MNTSILSDEELVDFTLNGEIMDPIVVARRFDKHLSENDQQNMIPEEDAVKWAIACFTSHAGEDFHQELIDRLLSAIEMNKKEMIEEVKNVINCLNDLDSMACSELEYMQNDGVQ